MNLEFDFLTCIKDAIAVGKDLSNFINDVNNKKDISSLISDLEGIVSDLQSALPACGAGNFMTEVAEPKVGDISSCISDIETVVGTVQKLSADINAKDISSFISDATTLISQIKQTVADCKSSKQ